MGVCASLVLISLALVSCTTQDNTGTSGDDAADDPAVDPALDAEQDPWGDPIGDPPRDQSAVEPELDAGHDALVDPTADAPTSTLGIACSSSRECSTGEWCPTRTTERRCSPLPTVESEQIPFQYVPAGSFTMGSPFNETGRLPDEEQVSVTLTRPFFMQRTELTQGQWMALSGGTNPSWTVNVNGPVEQVTWWSLMAYANALSTWEGLPTCYKFPSSDCRGRWQEGTLLCANDSMPLVMGVTPGNVYTCTGYRLPTEAEWEYAARAGTTAATYAGNLSRTNRCVTLSGEGGLSLTRPLADLAWYNCNARGRLQPVGGKTPNDWGLYDMLGNVDEWVWDRYNITLPGGTDPRAESSGTWRPVRGGDWHDPAFRVRAAKRSATTPNTANYWIGGRLVRTAP